MDSLNVKYELDALLEKIANNARSYQGAPLNNIIKRISAVEGDENSGRIIVPAWFSVFEHGRGPRDRAKTQTDWETWDEIKMSTFQRAIYFWMKKRGLLKAKTPKGQYNEAKRLAWYINKKGNAHRQAKVYIDIYTTFVKELTTGLEQKIRQRAVTVTSQLVKL
jgi:hypothetical protein